MNIKSAFMLVSSLSFALRAQTSQKIVVPAYFGIPPTCTTPGPGCSIPALGKDWTRILQAGSAVQIVVVDGSFGAANFSGIGDAKTQFSLNRGAGQLVLGYIVTHDKNGVLVPVDCQDLTPPQNPPCTQNTTIMNQVNQWYSNYPNHPPPPNGDGSAQYIDGIFFDVGPDLDLGSDSSFDLPPIVRPLLM